MSKILDVQDLHVSFKTYNGEVKAVRGVSFDVNKGETVAIVGESGCGKSVTSQTIMRLIPNPPGMIKGGEIIFEGKDLAKLSEDEMQSIRGAEIAMIFQDPMTSLNPTLTVGRQITEGLMKHQKMNANDAKVKAIEMLRLVGIPSPESRIKQYPHQFSGGMRQRAMIAIALSCAPKLLIADEPTTALDVTIQAQIIDLMKDLQEKIETSIILITHDLGVVADIADRVVVMYAGKVVETGTLEEVFYSPKHPYTWGLLASMPRLDQSSDQELLPIPGSPPDLLSPPTGCAFAARCKHAMKICQQQMPEATSVSDSHRVTCWLEHPMAPDVKPPIEIGGEAK
ncbi:ABC transporter ATP-binding protein [Hazenella coriacea]|uniref:Oligopeptide transport system ATP-binding protein n=1 Tax=Hazenella coriacea TaxID=1179467 RepID=A0A4R3LC73_9BACL|nr:ABC transporter ATP-binding protein [Hazenella coriacea]TCS96908.1 oligopeptide transport system ATP-binding protein [Hazenella coriacea]